ncbi:MAG: hypothetical protein FJY81_04170, partial [Candidatus Aminicenantes bacterium]|nr:hypothetical protein [Candidatus Aminicenantes bacterium]
MIPFEDRFGLSPEASRKVLGAALSRGGDFAEIYGEYRVFTLINMEEDILKETAASVSLGLGIRTISGDRTGYGYTNDLRLEKILEAARTAAAIASGQARKSRRLFRTVHVRKIPYLAREPVHEVGLALKIELVKKAYAACRGFDPRVKKAKAILQDHVQHVFVVNSEGQSARDVRPQVRLICTAVAE